MLKRLLLFTTMCVMPTVDVQGQLDAAQQPQSLPFGLKSESRLVVEDVSVTDAQGKPVQGLPATAFHVFERRDPQVLRDFQEIDGHANEDVSGTSKQDEQPGTFSNASLLRNQGTVVVLLLDPETISIEDQMYLRLQALKFVDQASLNTSIAVFRANRGLPVLLQPLTRDKAKLKAALTAAVPVFTRPTDGVFQDALIELRNISDYLRPVPGHKAVIWLAGAFPLYQEPNYESLCSDSSCGLGPSALTLSAQQDAYRALAEARIAVYPVDVRGVLQGGPVPVPIVPAGTSLGGSDPSGKPGNIQGNVGAKPVSQSERASGQYDEMDRLAEATGGHAFYSNNDVSAILTNALQLTTQGYTLTYRPKNETRDGKWRPITIRVDGPYIVHYRTGYYAPDAAGQKPAAARRSLAVDGVRPVLSPPVANPDSAITSGIDSSTASKTTATSLPSRTSTQSNAAQQDSASSAKPLVFTAHLVSEPKAKKMREVKVRYVIPADQLSFEGEASGHARFQLAALAYNANGDVLSRSIEVVNTRYSSEQMQLVARLGTPADQTIEVVKGAHYLLLSVLDLRTRKVGVVQLPLQQVPDGDTPASGVGPSGETNKP